MAKTRGKGSFPALCLQAAEASLAIGREAQLFCRFSCDLARGTRQALRHPSKVKWNSVGHYMDSCGADAVPIIALLGFLIGLILAFQAIVQLSRFGVEGYVVNLVGTVLVTELSPLVTAVVLSGRTGSSFAAELSMMNAAEEVDAMVTLGFDTGRFLLVPKLLAMILILPGLTIIADACGIIGGGAVICSMLNVSAEEYVSKSFEIIEVVDLSQGLVKSVIFGIIIAMIGCMKGLNAERNPQGIGRATTSTVVTSIFLIVLSDAVMTALFGLLR